MGFSVNKYYQPCREKKKNTAFYVTIDLNISIKFGEKPFGGLSMI